MAKAIKKLNFYEINQLSILDVARDLGINFERQTSDSLVAFCPSPFHQDNKNPNFFVTPSKNLFYCFCCGQGGGPIDLVMFATGNDDLMAAAKYLADKYQHGYEEVNNIPVWDGLTEAEYNKFGLGSPQIKIPVGFVNGKEQWEYSRVDIKNLAKEQPERHDSMLIGKFLERVVAISCLYGGLKDGILDVPTSHGWFKACGTLIEDLLELLRKGLRDKTRIEEVIQQEKSELAKLRQIFAFS